MDFPRCIPAAVGKPTPLDGRCRANAIRAGSCDEGSGCRWEVHAFSGRRIPTPISGDGLAKPILSVA